MKYALLLIAAGLVACSPPADEQPAGQPAPTAPATTAATPTATEQPATVVSATGVVESVDSAAGTVVIAHGPIAELKWPAMTMTFQAQDVDLTAISPGDSVRFEFTSTGMDGRITSITRQ